jgi:hypothetical protein
VCGEPAGDSTVDAPATPINLERVVDYRPGVNVLALA